MFVGYGRPNQWTHNELPFRSAERGGRFVVALGKKAIAHQVLLQRTSVKMMKLC
jgi:hypothetical protein